MPSLNWSLREVRKAWFDNQREAWADGEHRWPSRKGRTRVNRTHRAVLGGIYRYLKRQRGLRLYAVAIVHQCQIARELGVSDSYVWQCIEDLCQLSVELPEGRVPLLIRGGRIRDRRYEAYRRGERGAAARDKRGKLHTHPRTPCKFMVPVAIVRGLPRTLPPRRVRRAGEAPRTPHEIELARREESERRWANNPRLASMLEGVTAPTRPTMADAIAELERAAPSLVLGLSKNVLTNLLRVADAARSARPPPGGANAPPLAAQNRRPALPAEHFLPASMPQLQRRTLERALARQANDGKEQRSCHEAESERVYTLEQAKPERTSTRS